MAKKVFDAAVSTGTYTDSQGQEKKRWVNVGAVFEHDGGGMSLKLETVPVGKEWSGWISFFVKEREYQQPKEASKANAYQPQADASGGFDEVPF